MKKTPAKRLRLDVEGGRAPCLSRAIRSIRRRNKCTIPRNKHIFLISEGDSADFLGLKAIQFFRLDDLRKLVPRLLPHPADFMPDSTADIPLIRYEESIALRGNNAGGPTRDFGGYIARRSRRSGASSGIPPFAGNADAGRTIHCAAIYTVSRRM